MTPEDPQDPPSDPAIRALATQLARTILGLVVAAPLPAQLRISVVVEAVAILLAFYTDAVDDEELVEVVGRELRRLLAVQRPQVESLLAQHGLERRTPEEVAEAEAQRPKETIH